MVKILRSQNGMADIIIPIIIIIIFTTYQFNSQYRILSGVKNQLRLREKENLKILYSTMVELIDNQHVLEKSINLAGNANTFLCLKSNTCAAPIDPAAFLYVNGRGEVISGPDIYGVDSNLQACEQEGSNLCYFQIEVTWKPLCEEGIPCLNPDVELVFQLTHTKRGAEKFNFNLSTYRYVKVVSGLMSSLN